MPRKPQKAKLRDGNYNIVLRIPGWLKNEIIAHCKKKGISINDWATTNLLTALREDKGLPPAPPPMKPLPTHLEQLRAYISGETLIQPCGKTDCEPVFEQLQNMKFCTKCGVRGK
jgi:hypothetical protein